jgi:hypothetical protein
VRDVPLKEFVYLDGERAVLYRSRMPTEQVLRLGPQLADALAHAKPGSAGTCGAT